MNLLEAMEQRHAIRAYTDEPVDQAILDILRAEIDACNQESGLHIQMAAGLDDAFLGLKTHYGRFTGVHNAIALIGRAERGGAADDAMVDAGGHDTATEPAAGVAESGSAAIATPNNAATAAWHKSTAVDEAATDPSEIALQERVGYYGERVALRAVQLGWRPAGPCWTMRTRRNTRGGACTPARRSCGCWRSVMVHGQAGDAAASRSRSYAGYRTAWRCPTGSAPAWRPRCSRRRR